MGGADMRTVAELPGHKTLIMARRYQHLSPAFLAAAAGKLDTVFGEAAQAADGVRFKAWAGMTAILQSPGARTEHVEL
jgi:hypothetical protein